MHDLSYSCGSWKLVVMACGLSCPAVCGMFLEQGLNPHVPSRFMIDSRLLDDQEIPYYILRKEANVHKPHLRRGS